MKRDTLEARKSRAILISIELNIKTISHQMAYGMSTKEEGSTKE
jgi:hypothetical protein